MPWRGSKEEPEEEVPLLPPDEPSAELDELPPTITKVYDLEPWELCTDPNHEGPEAYPRYWLKLPPGGYKHECPSCGRSFMFKIKGVRDA